MKRKMELGDDTLNLLILIQMQTLRDPAYQRHQFHDSLRVFEDAVLAEDVRADELDVLRDVGLRGADARDALLDVVQEALGERGVLVQVHQVRSLQKGGEIRIRKIA